MNNYRSISCAFYDVLELLAMRRRRCVIEYISPDGSLKAVEAAIADVFAREGAEYMLLTSGETIRLDSLTSVDGVKPDAFGS